MRYVDSDVVAQKILEKGISVRKWAESNGFKPYQVFTVLHGRASKQLAKVVADRLVADGLIDEEHVNMGTRFMSVREVAEFLSVSPQTIRAWINNKSHGFPFINFGSVIRIEREELERWVEEKRRGA